MLTIDGRMALLRGHHVRRALANGSGYRLADYTLSVNSLVIECVLNED